MNGNLFALLAAAILLAFGGRWLMLMRAVRIPADVRPYLAATIAAAVLGVAAFAAGVGPLGGVAAALAIVAGIAFPALYAGSGQSSRPPAVSVGGPVIDFAAGDDAGAPFELASLRGRPFLLKFFRGHWCPYCVAELRRWEEMRPVLDAHDIAIVTVCSDNAEQIRRGRGKHGLGAVMLPDPELAITDRYGLRNPRNFAPKPGVIIPLPIPTTILVDAAGIVRWIDQSSDYMHRSEPARVLAAIKTMLAQKEPSAVSPIAGTAEIHPLPVMQTANSVEAPPPHSR